MRDGVRVSVAVGNGVGVRLAVRVADGDGVRVGVDPGGDVAVRVAVNVGERLPDVGVRLGVTLGVGVR